MVNMANWRVQFLLAGPLGTCTPLGLCSGSITPTLHKVYTQWGIGIATASVESLTHKCDTFGEVGVCWGWPVMRTESKSGQCVQKQEQGGMRRATDYR